jgi:predicted kinase
VGDSHSSARLIIVCGLPGSGKTTHAKQVEEKLRAVRFCPDDWMDALGIGLWDGESRERVEKLQWKLAQEILALGHNVVIEWGTWGRSERDALRCGARALGPLLSFISSTLRSKSYLTESGAGIESRLLQRLKM